MVVDHNHESYVNLIRKRDNCSNCIDDFGLASNKCAEFWLPHITIHVRDFHLKCFVTTNEMRFKNFILSSLPWNRTTFLGYLGEIVFTALLGLSYMTVNGVVLTLFISICYHHLAFYTIFKQSIDRYKRRDERFLCDLIRFHISIKRYSCTAFKYISRPL